MSFGKLTELRKQREFALSKAESLVATAERENRNISAAENLEINTSMAAVKSLDDRIKAIEKNNTITKMFDTKTGTLLVDGGRPFQKPAPVTFSEEYGTAFYQWIAKRGNLGSLSPEMSAALYEGSSPAGGYAVPVIVDNVIVPLAPNEMAVRQLATVIPTVADLKIPIKSAHGTSAAKGEGDGTGANLFAGTDPTLTQKTLSAFMAGHVEDVSWELAQDVPAFQAFSLDDLIISQQQYEENKYINGTGTGQPEGIIGHVDAGVSAATADGSGNLLSIDSTFDLMATLNAVYFPNASWLMQRAAGIELRKAQKQSNLFEPVFTSVNGQDYLHGFPVQYSSYMPSVAAGNTPVLFGDFKRAYVIGDRGGSGINIKILDQPKAKEGLIELLAYRRTDGRVRRSEAVKSLTLHT